MDTFVPIGGPLDPHRRQFRRHVDFNRTSRIAMIKVPSAVARLGAAVSAASTEAQWNA